MSWVDLRKTHPDPLLNISLAHDRKWGFRKKYG